MSCSNEHRRLGPSESYERFKARARIRKAKRKSAKVSLNDLMDAFKGLKANGKLPVTINANFKNGDGLSQ